MTSDICSFCLVVLILVILQYCFTGKKEFSPEEDAHVIGDCIKVFGKCSITISLDEFTLIIFFSVVFVCLSQYILREMPSSAVPAACCTALVEAYCKFDLKILSIY
jgi:hypothetical protein